jgi:hypothetical protein
MINKNNFIATHFGVRNETMFAVIEFYPHYRNKKIKNVCGTANKTFQNYLLSTEQSLYSIGEALDCGIVVRFPVEVRDFFLT